MKILSTIFFLFISVTLTAQIPNAGFESWTGNTPDNWYANNLAPFYTTITKSSTTHSGTGAARGEVANYAGIPMIPVLISGTLGGQGFPLTQRYASLKGYFQFNSVQADYFTIILIMYNNNQVIGSGEFMAPSSVNSYTQFGADITYIDNTTVPDMCNITVFIENDTVDGHFGSYFLLDDIELSSQSVGVIDGNIVKTFRLDQNYPNPFNPSTRIKYEIPAEEFVTLKVFDAIGNEISTLVNERKPSGTYFADFNAAGLSNGIYFYRLTSGSLTEVKKMVLLK